MARQWLMGLVLLGTAPLLAGHCGCGEWSLTGEALYWAPTSCDFLFAQVGHTEFGFSDPHIGDLPTETELGEAVEGSYEQQITCPDYDWGVRVGLHYARDCWFMRAQYLWLETNETKHVERGNNNTLAIPLFLRGADSLVNFETATGSVEDIYQNFDFTMGREICRTCRSSLHVLASAQGICARGRRRVTAAGEQPPFGESVVPLPLTGEHALNDTFTGLGLGTGFLIGADIGCALSLHGEVLGLAVVGYNTGDIVNRAITVVVDPVDPNYQTIVSPSRVQARTCFLPAFKARLALEYCCDLCCGNLCASVGYETHYYFTLLAAATENIVVQDQPSNSTAITENAGWGGLTLGLTLGF